MWYPTVNNAAASRYSKVEERTHETKELPTAIQP